MDVSLLRERGAEGKVGGEQDGKAVEDLDGALTAGTLSISSGSGVLPATTTKAAITDGDSEETGNGGGGGNGVGSDPPSPSEYSAGLTVSRPLTASGSAGRNVARETKLHQQENLDSVGAAAAAAADVGDNEELGGGAQGRTSNGFGGGGEGVRFGARVHGEEKGDDGIVQRLVPPSFSSTNLVRKRAPPFRSLWYSSQTKFNTII